MATMYAWSPINKVDEKTGRVSADIKVGDSVSKSDVGDDWDYLVETGAIREQKYPPVDDGQSPTEYFKALSAKAASGNLGSDEMDMMREFVTTNLVDPGAGISPMDTVEGLPEAASATTVKDK